MSSTLPQTAAEDMATAAMSDNFTIGSEQIIVSLVLLLVSSFLLSRKPKSKMSIKAIIKRLTKRWSSSSLSHEEGRPLSDATAPIRKSKSSGFVAWTNDNIASSTVCTEFIFGSYGEDDSETNNSILEEETFYTDHERFANAYQNTIQHSEYRKLVLPPECKLLDRTKIKSRQTDITATAADTWVKLVEDFHKIISFDFIGYLIHFILRIFQALQYRWMKMWGLGIPEEDEEEDDDNTVTSNGSRRSLLSKEGSVQSVTRGQSLVQSQGQSGSRQNLNGFVSAPSTPLCPSKQGGNQMEINSITTSNSETLAIQQSESLDSSTAGSISYGKQRDRFYTGDEHDLNPRLFERSLDRMSPKKQNSTFYDDSFDISTHSLEDLSEDMHEDTWVPLYQDNYASNLSPVRGVAGDKRDYQHASIDGSHSSSLGDNDYGTQSSTQAQSSNATNTLDSLSLPALPRKSAGIQVQKKKDNLEKWRTASKSLLRQLPVPVINVIDAVGGVEQKIHEMVYFDSATNDASLKKMEREAPMPDREGYILGDQFLVDPRDTPLLVFVNTRAGSQQGPILKTQLRSLLNPIQIWDLADGGPEKILKSFSVLSRLRILVCGGDGTVSWIISTLDKMQLDRWPPLAILPLGTGNDLARMHGTSSEYLFCIDNENLCLSNAPLVIVGWGSGYANESLLMILDQVKESYISLLDRWTLNIECKKKKKATKKKTESKPFINYMSIGMDAISALQVHNLRENSPNMFFSRAVNKVWYALFGAEDAIKASCSDLPNQIILEADGVEVPIPKDSQGLIFLNIDSYMGGVPLWSRGVSIQKRPARQKPQRRYSEGDFLDYDSDDDHFGEKRQVMSSDESDSISGDGSIVDNENIDMTPEDRLARIMNCTSPSSCQDGKLDVISHRGNFHLGQIRVGLSNAQRLCQCSKVKITMKKGTAVQVDGEPWKQDSGTLTIERQKDPAMMLHRALEEGGGIETEVANLLEWAEEKKIIMKDTHDTLMKEFSRRIEKKTRARRNKTRQTVFASMKKRIASSNRFPSNFE